MSSQDQKVGEGSSAIQSGRDTVIQQGVSTEQMKEIIGALADQVSAYAAVARGIVDARLADFEGRILERFTQDGEARPDAFRDPDFQYLLNRGQHAYARSGKSEISDILVDLIAERSKQDDRTRLSLSLNDAVEKSAVLTINEFAELSIVFIILYTFNKTVANFEGFVSYVRQYISPFIPDISREDASYWYLQSHGCVSIEVGEANFLEAFRKNYGGLFSKGFDVEILNSHLPDDKKDVFEDTNLIRKCLNDDSKLQINAVREDDFLVFAKDKDIALTEAQLKNVWAMNRNAFFSDHEMLDALRPKLPELQTLYEVWNSTPLKNTRLTSVGIAIGHANARRVGKFDAGLEIWIK